MAKPAPRQCLLRSGTTLTKLRGELQRRWRTLDEATRSALSRELVLVEADLRNAAPCRQIAMRLGWSRQVLKRGALRSQVPTYRVRGH